jgi:hypothetical protein
MLVAAFKPISRAICTWAGMKMCEMAHPRPCTQTLEPQRIACNRLWIHGQEEPNCRSLDHLANIHTGRNASSTRFASNTRAFFAS